ncbi:MAG: phosphoribosylamine--glycine ligase [Chloroflexi bacterium]|nr:phosphoribosylamine--glycine ligase [Chloroflexota bacterium]|tara:strand:+ start:1600 stop:2862 length:1263 start_codon:yes stop_codon:yes gene_type:complete
MGINVLIVGSGGREHAIAWKLSQSPKLEKLWAIPGNAGINNYAEIVDIKETDINTICKFVENNTVDLTIVGPEIPLAIGITDNLNQQGFRVIGPTKAAAQLETSKSFAKKIMRDNNIPTAHSKTFTDAVLAKEYIHQLESMVVIKADGLAAGKGVTVCDNLKEAEIAIDKILIEKAYGDAGTKILVEERMFGRETSAHAFTDGISVRHMPFSCDHKPVYNNNLGPNTGGMGVYSPPQWLSNEIRNDIEQNITERAIQSMAENQTPYSGIIYPGLMITEIGPRVVEFNARFGDPETEVLLPKLETDLLEIFDAIGDKRLSEVEVSWNNNASVGVVLASGGYPNSYEIGKRIYGLEDIDSNIQIFMSGVMSDDNDNLYTAGGRVLCVVASGDSIDSARELAYSNVNRISFEGMHYRTDIGSV